MAELRDTADKLTYARRALIDLTQNFNQKLVTFPSNLIAGLFGFKKQKGLATPMSGEHVEVSESETHDIKVDL
jgi:LemA protein